MAIVYPPPPWTNQDLVLFHGTTLNVAKEVVAGRIRVASGRLGTDFGPGFYTTTILKQAHRWATERAEKESLRGTVVHPAVVELAIGREDLARLEVQAFVRGDEGAEDFWSFVHFCRKAALDHGRIKGKGGGFYDMVCGPVAAFWNQNGALGNSDQFSFHTRRAERILNLKVRRRMISL